MSTEITKNQPPDGQGPSRVEQIELLYPTGGGGGGVGSGGGGGGGSHSGSGGGSCCRR